MLASLFFRLGVEQRAREIGLLRSVGYTNARVTRLFVMEGVALAALGGLLGVGGAVAYGALMIAGLRTWWSGCGRRRCVFTCLQRRRAGAATTLAAVLCASGGRPHARDCRNAACSLDAPPRQARITAAPALAAVARDVGTA
jgi:ABC-type antimicrobial peptide transport system permease subunit